MKTYRDRWNDIAWGHGVPLEWVQAPYGAEGLSADTATILQDIGLPASAPPCLNFDELAFGVKPLLAVYEQPSYWSDADRSRLAPFLMIGTDGSGDPICVDTSCNEQIVLLDHEVKSAGKVFVNTGLPHFIECLLIYAKMIQAHLQEQASLDDLTDEIPLVLWEKAWARLAVADLAATEKGTFWHVAMRTFVTTLPARKEEAT